MYTYLAIERTPGFLKTEIVVQILVREVAAFKRDIIAAILQTIAQCQVMGELVGYHEILVLATDGLRIVGEAVHVLVVVSHGQYIPFLPEVAPIEVYVKISKLIGHIGNACLVTEIFHRVAGTADLHLLIVTHIHLREVAAHTQPASEAIACRYIVSLRQHLAIVGISGPFFSSAQVLDITLDIILRIAVYHTAFHVDGMFSKTPGITQVQVDVVTFLGTDADVSTLQVFVTKHLFDSGQAVSFFIRELRLQAGQDEVGSGSTISPRVYRTAGAYIITTGIILGNLF